MSDLPTNSSGSASSVPQGLAADRLADLRQAFFLHARRCLQESAADPGRSAAIACLATHGFDLGHLDSVPIGLMPTTFNMRAALTRAGFTAEEIRASGMVGDPRLPGRLVGPIAEAAGRIISLWGWSPTGEAPRCLYAQRGWKSEAGLFGMDVALPALSNGPGSLVVVPEILDALLLHSHGMQRAAAIGGSGREMMPDRWHRLARLGVSRATLVLGDCPTRAGGTAAAIQNASRAEAAPEIYVLGTDKLPAMKGLGDTIHSLGISVLAALVEHDLVHGFTYQARVLLARHKPDGGWTDAARHAALAEATQFYAAADPSNTAQLDTFFVPPILEELGPHANDQHNQSLWFDETAEEPDMGDGPNFRASESGSVPLGACSKMAEKHTAEPLSPELPTAGRKAVVSAPAPVVPADQSTGRPSADICPLHGCHRAKCFCWD